MFRTIVVGCDGTSAADEAVALAQQLHDPEGGRLVLVSVFSMYEGIASPSTPIVYADWLKDRAEHNIARARAHLDADVAFECRTVAAPSPGAGIDMVARAVSADLIVVGASHRGRIGTLTGRCTVQKLLHGAPCAVAVAAPDHGPLGPGGRIAVAYDGSPEAVLALETAFALAERTGARVALCMALQQIVYMSGYAAPLPDMRFEKEREADAQARLDEVARHAPAGVEVETRIGWGAGPRTILTLADGADLLIAGSRGYGPLHRVLAGSTSIALLTDGHLPVLVVPRVAAARRETPAPEAVAG